MDGTFLRGINKLEFQSQKPLEKRLAGVHQKLFKCGDDPT